jgi:hypothetical protein
LDHALNKFIGKVVREVQQISIGAFAAENAGYL